MMKEKSSFKLSYKWYNICKRFMDVAIGLAGIAICAFPMLIIAYKIKNESKGPVIFKQERLGKNGKPFTLYKFRTMRIDAEKNGAQWAVENDPRCTQSGKMLRKYRLDELPQLFNIIKGEMSVVGPRPERSFFYNEFDKTLVDFRDRLEVLPGLTGLAQIQGGYNLSPSEKLVYDKEYIRRRSLWLDTKIILKTIPIIFTHEGAR